MFTRARPLAVRLGQSANTQSSTRLGMVQIRHIQSSQPRAEEAPTMVAKTSAGDAGEVKRTDLQGGVAIPSHQPDYDAEVDYRTSSFSPIPRRVADGSEPGASLPAAVLSGAPIDLQARTVRIYKPTKAATQSGTWHGMAWLMDWDPLPKGHRWENPLMGWQSSADFMQGERIGFKTKEEAITFAEKQGYEYFVQEPNVRKFKPKSYANNFAHVPGRLKLVFTK